MSFLARSQPIRLINQAARTTSPYAVRTFTVSSIQNKSVVDTAKDVLKTVDRKVSDKLVDGVEVAQREIKDSREASRAFSSAVNSVAFDGETVTKKTKEVTGMENAGSKAKGAMYEAEGSAEQMAGQASGTASKMAGQASGKASEMAGKAKGAAAELGGDLKSKANEVEGAAKGRSAELQGKSGTAKPGVKGM